ncbi:hypothetical protein Tco_0655816 [Tanacetum coccineum]|uniref:Uncharacterized protein n=1 Tax=Tanacetum coccineum TaxID=301880 RepID=A0ABQ4X892_9ASTR
MTVSEVINQAVMADALSQQAASMTYFDLLGDTFPMSYAKTQVSILKGVRTRCRSVLQRAYHIINGKLAEDKKCDIYTFVAEIRSAQAAFGTMGAY